MTKELQSPKKKKSGREKERSIVSICNKFGGWMGFDRVLNKPQITTK